MPDAAVSTTVSSGQMITITGLNKWFGTFHVLKDVSLTVAKQEKIVVCGPSGSGKSTLIRCINKLEDHQQGRIEVDGIVLDENVKNIEQIGRAHV